jgi:predicted dinucleotide-binding enzyme
VVRDPEGNGIQLWQPMTPDEARTLTEQPSRDAGFDPIYGGTLENARVLEDFLAVAAANLSDGGHSFYRFWRP